MTLFQNQYRIESARYQSWDYSASGYYFVTICTHQKQHFFGHIADGKMQLSKAGVVAHKIWEIIPNHFANVLVDEFVVMPNHVHGIVVIHHSNSDIPSHPEFGRDAINRVSTGLTVNGNTVDGPTRNGFTHAHNPMLSHHSLGKIVRWYKGRCTFEIRQCSPEFAWQTRFYDRIIRNTKSLEATRLYISNNPGNWRI